MTDWLRFARQAVRHGRTVGAVAPSGRPLARAVADAVGGVGPGQLVVELGPGTGVFTAELLRRFPATRLVAVERLPAFADRLAARFPAVTVVTGDAADLPRLGLAPAAVVSGLPLLSLPGDLPARVLAAVAAVLPPGGRFVQFTYSERAWGRFATPGLVPAGRRRVWANLPPAVVLTFTRAVC